MFTSVCGSLSGWCQPLSLSVSSSASLLSCGIFQTSGQVSIVPFIGLEGYRSFLDLENIPEDAQEYSWHRGVHDSEGSMIVSYKPPSNAWQAGPMFSGRENVTTEGRLSVKNSMLNDTGNYTVRVDVSNGTHRATSWLEIRGELTGCPISLKQELGLEALGVRSLGDHIVQFCQPPPGETGSVGRWLSTFSHRDGSLTTLRDPISLCISYLLVLQHNKYPQT